MTLPEFAVVGPGRLGLALVARLEASGWRCTRLLGRRPPGSRAVVGVPSHTRCSIWPEPAGWTPPRLVFLAVPDDQITTAAEQLVHSTGGLTGRVVLHTSGVHTAAVLASCVTAGARVASWHPLQSFPPRGSGRASWNGVACAIEGDEEAVDLGFAAASACGMRPWRIDASHKARYHAAAAVGGNLTHILVVAARELLAGCGLEPSETGPVLAPLVRASVQSALEGQGMEGLTGPIARADEQTVERHLEVLDPALSRAYRELAKVARQRLLDGPRSR